MGVVLLMTRSQRTIEYAPFIELKVFVTAFLSACSRSLFRKVPYDIPDSTRYLARGNKDRGYNQHTARIPVDDISTIKLPTSKNRSNQMYLMLTF